MDLNENELPEEAAEAADVEAADIEAADVEVEAEELEFEVEVDTDDDEEATVEEADEKTQVGGPEMGEVVELPVVGGLHHRYTRRAA